MSVTIKRKTGLVGSGSKLRLWLDGVETASIYEGREVELELPDGVNQLSASGWGLKSNQVEVQDGDTLEIRLKWFHRYSMWFFWALVTGLFFLRESIKNSLLVTLILGLVMIGLLMLSKGLDIQVKNRLNQANEPRAVTIK